jgi:hypothetical protein
MKGGNEMRKQRTNSNRTGMKAMRAAVAVAAASLAAGAGALWAGDDGRQGPIIGGTPAGGSNQSLFTIKLGYMTKPKAESFGDAWLVGLNWDTGLSRNIALGFEVQMAYRSSEESGLRSFPILGWFHLKVGENLGRFVPALKPFHLYAGAGAGGEMILSIITLEELTETQFSAHFGFKLMAGTIINLGGVSLVLEYQMARISDPLLDPHFWRHHVFLGFMF